MGLTINPLPPNFVSSAKREIASTNKGREITTEQILESGKEVHKMFQDRGYYTAIKNSPIFTEVKKS